MVLVAMALVCSMCLLTSDTKLHVPLGFSTPEISAAPLLLIGASFLVAQAILRPRWTELLKNMLLAGTFILWGIVQLMAQKSLSKRLGDVVVALYVFDLALVVFASVTASGAIRLSSPRSDSSEESA